MEWFHATYELEIIITTTFKNKISDWRARASSAIQVTYQFVDSYLLVARLNWKFDNFTTVNCPSKTTINELSIFNIIIIISQGDRSSSTGNKHHYTNSKHYQFAPLFPVRISLINGHIGIPSFASLEWNDIQWYTFCSDQKIPIYRQKCVDSHC